MILDKADRAEKLLIGPNTPNAGPTFPMHVATAVKVDSISKPSSETTRKQNPKIRIYNKKNTKHSVTVSSLTCLPSRVTILTLLGCNCLMMVFFTFRSMII